MHSEELPDLTFPGLTYGKYQTPWDLRRWLYRCGAATDIRLVDAMIDAGELGHPLLERVALVQSIHEVLSNDLGRGASRHTVERSIKEVGLLFRWADETGYQVSSESVEQCYRLWTDSLLQRARLGQRLAERTAYNYAKGAGSVLDRALSRGNSIVRTTRLRRPKPGGHAVTPRAEKQSLEEAFALGHLLLDIADGLNVKAIWGPLPVRIPLRNGRALEEWSGLKRPETLKPPNLKYPRQVEYLAKLRAQNKETWEAERTPRTRYPLINLRIQAELFMLMAQPAVNLAQAHQLRMDQWRYKASTHGYEVRTYKRRRMGAVVFEIYSQYRQVFERYLRWRREIFPTDHDGLLFPLLGIKGRRISRLPETRPEFNLIKKACARAGIKYLPPSELRGVNVNWMLRRSQDPDLTAEEKQHSTKTLLRSYERPSLQRAMVQIKGFWAKYDPAQAAAGPGACTGNEPEPIHDIPAVATKPDCLTPAGCLFCKYQRDIDSLDHMWSLVSYRYLKSIELGLLGPASNDSKSPQHPAECAIERITAKLEYIKNTNGRRSDWIREALVRIEEGRYHPAWAGIIETA